MTTFLQALGAGGPDIILPDDLSIEERVYRMKDAAEPSPNTKVGSTRCHAESQKRVQKGRIAQRRILEAEEGKILISTAKALSKQWPKKKGGNTDTNQEMTVRTLSSLEYCLVADMMPHGIPMSSASISEDSARIKVGPI